MDLKRNTPIKVRVNGVVECATFISEYTYRNVKYNYCSIDRIHGPLNTYGVPDDDVVEVLGEVSAPKCATESTGRRAQLEKSLITLTQRSAALIAQIKPNEHNPKIVSKLREYDKKIKLRQQQLSELD